MKNIFLLLPAICLFFIGCASTGTQITEPVTYTEVIEAPGVKQADLYVKVNMWFVDAFKSADSVIQFSDKDSGIIKGKYIGEPITAGIYFCKTSSTITVEIKDEKYRIIFTDPLYQYTGDFLNGTYLKPGNQMPIQSTELADKIKKEWIALAENLKKAVISNSSSW